LFTYIQDMQKGLLLILINNIYLNAKWDNWSLRIRDSVLIPAVFVSRTRMTEICFIYTDPLCTSCPAIIEHSFQRSICTTSEPLVLFTGKVIYEFRYFSWKKLWNVMCAPEKG
jgi:hypothetical protein